MAVRVEGSTRKRASKPASPAPAAPTVPALSAKPQEGKTVPVFTLDDVEYRAPESVSYAVTVAYLHEVADGTPMRAELIMLDRVLGPDAFAALKSATNLTKEQYRAIVNQCSAIMLGNIEQEAEQGN